VTRLDRTPFRGFKKLKVLDLSHNHLSSFDRSDFSDLLSLQVLRMSGNRNLTKLPQSLLARTLSSRL
jgi:Leucine-rich repeat (LRR) protein